MNRIDKLFVAKKNKVLNMYYTAGYPQLNSTVPVIVSLQDNGADIIEIGIPYSDPLADGEVIQQSSAIALQNGMSIPLLFEQLKNIRRLINIPVILMGYLNPVLQFGFENFCAAAASAGVDGFILPDLPMYEYETQYATVMKKYGLHLIFLVTPDTADERVKKIDELSGGFLYAVSSSSTTGKQIAVHDGLVAYLERLNRLQLKNPILVGFGINDQKSFELVCNHANGAIIGSAYIKALAEANDIETGTAAFMQKILGT
ncbi:MAG: tryptophan synthase subunit alpha [Ferruginibacter sp.]